MNQGLNCAGDFAAVTRDVDLEQRAADAFGEIEIARDIGSSEFYAVDVVIAGSGSTATRYTPGIT